MALSAKKTTAVWQTFIDVAQRSREGVPWDKPLMVQVVGAVDAWIESQSVAYNQALPQAFRSTATAEEKATLLCLTTLARMSNEDRNALFATLRDMTNGS